MKELVIVLCFIVLLSGLFHDLVYSNLSRVAVISLIYFLGFLSLLFIRSSADKPKKNRWLILIVGFLCCLIATVALEGLFKEHGRR